MPWSKTGGVKDDEIVLLAPQSSKHPEKGERPKRLPLPSGSGPGEEQVGLPGYGPRE
jgi:hypothetical protein